MREVGLPGGRVIVHGHYGRPVLVFPAERGQATEAQDRGLVESVGELLSAGRLKLYCVDSDDSAGWSAQHKPLEDRARAAEWYDSWIMSTVVPFVAEDCGGGPVELAATGVSMGALHALNITLRHAETFVLAPLRTTTSIFIVQGHHRRTDRQDSYASAHGDGATG